MYEFKEEYRKFLEVQNCISLNCALSGTRFDDLDTHLVNLGTTIHSFATTTSSSHYKYIIAISDENSLKTIYIAFNSTETIKEAFTDRSLLKYMPLETSDANIHAGLYREAMKIPLGYFISKLTQSHGENVKLVFTGHSLGGIIAECVALILLPIPGVRQDRVSVYTFGSPPIGDEALANFCDEKYSETFYSFHLQKDIIPIITRAGLSSDVPLINVLGGPLYDILNKPGLGFKESLQCFNESIRGITRPNILSHFGKQYICSAATGEWSQMTRDDIITSNLERISISELENEGMRHKIQQHWVDTYYRHLRTFEQIKCVRDHLLKYYPLTTYTRCIPEIFEVVAVSKYKINREYYCDLAIRGTNICHAVFWHQEKRCTWKLEYTPKPKILVKNFKVASFDISKEQLEYGSIFSPERRHVDIFDHISSNWEKRIESMGIGELLNIGFMFSAYKFIDDQQRNRLCIIMDDLEKVAGNQDTEIYKIEPEEAYEHFVKLLTGLSSVQDAHRNSQSYTDPKSDASSTATATATATSDTMTYAEARRKTTDIGAYELQQRLTKSVTLRVLRLLMAIDMSWFKSFLKKIGMGVRPGSKSILTFMTDLLNLPEKLVTTATISTVHHIYSLGAEESKSGHLEKASLYLELVDQTRLKTLTEILRQFNVTVPSPNTYSVSKKIYDMEKILKELLSGNGYETYEDVTRIRVQYENHHYKSYKDFIAKTKLWSTKEKVVPLLNILEVSMMVHEIRDIIGSYYVVGIIGDTRSGKSSFLYKLGFDSNPNASERTPDVRVYRTQTDSTKLVMVDFPGIDSYSTVAEDNIYYNTMLIGTYVAIGNIEDALNSLHLTDMLAKHMIRTQDSSNYIIFLSHVDVYILDILKQHDIPTAKERVESVIALLLTRIRYLTRRVEIYPVCLVLDYNNLPAELDEDILQSCGVLNPRRMMDKIKCFLNREGVACQSEQFNYR
ncbi:hypothetical protein K7432_009523 [Basidiobolus ranarum]|uniref:Fungal lipase-type domain-containing protein n=1 Tax=Basidiobolus ranarum TaxID=34480 RepID=A0ABR2VX16_9FUNG